jgi:hypothetical protein
MKSLTIKSLFEKFSRVKLGPFGKIERPLPGPLVKDAIEFSEDCQGLCTTSRPAIFRRSRAL